jgi:hypothetical protein
MFWSLGSSVVIMSALLMDSDSTLKETTFGKPGGSERERRLKDLRRRLFPRLVKED